LRPDLTRAAVRVGLDLTVEQADQLLAFLTLLVRWNATYNLTAVREPAAMLRQHLADCLAIVSPLRQRFGADLRVRTLDVGSGAGLPGLVLATLAPGAEVVCVDKVGKKVAFVRQAAAELGLRNLRAEHARVQELQAGRFGLVVARAFAPLGDFVAVTRHLLQPNGVWLAMKGKVPALEALALPADVELFHVERIEVPDLGADRCLVWMQQKQSPGTLRQSCATSQRQPPVTPPAP
jgi:16S rRNA (guanine527-N7)-methyltransferase